MTRWLMLGALPLIGVLYVGSLAVRPAPPAELLAAPTTKAACTQPPVFKPGYQRGEDFVIPQGQGFRFRSESWLEAEICAAGTLKITAQGELGGDELPQLTVALDSAVIATPSFDRERTVEIRIPHPGRVYLAYFNDYYRADVRVATLSALQLRGINCQGFKNIDMPKENAGTWIKESNTAIIVRNPPMTIVPCGPGYLTMNVKGRMGNFNFPVIELRQKQTLILKIKSSQNFVGISKYVVESPISISMKNPFGKTLVNRDLTIKKYGFIAKK